MSVLVRFQYPDSTEMHIEEIKLIGTFKKKEIDLINNNGYWKVELELEEGIYSYRFLVNNCLYLNDPLADEYVIIDEEVWSQFNVTLEDKETNSRGVAEYSNHVISNRLGNSLQSVPVQREFYKPLDKRVVLGLELDPILGLHEVVTIWYRPDGIIYHICYETLEVAESEGFKAGLVWFLMKLDEAEREYTMGIWTVIVTVDGKIVAQDKFDLKTRR